MVLDATDASTGAFVGPKASACARGLISGRLLAERLAGEQHPFQATTGLLNRVLDDDERSLFSCGGKGAQIGCVNRNGRRLVRETSSRACYRWQGCRKSNGSL